MTMSPNNEHEPRMELSYRQINRDLLRTMEPAGRLYYAVLGVDLVILLWGIFAWVYQIKTGIGVTNLNNPVGWGVYIATFVFWIGIAHSGTLISAILFLFRCHWCNPIYRTAEAMTVFALLTAGLYPIIHLGRPWLFYWLFPYPQEGHLWINFRSPLVWDVFAVGTYLIVSAVFFFTGLVPDLAVVRDQADGWRKKIYGFLAQGWQGTDRQWRHYGSAYLFLAALATPLVISVHSIVSWDFAMSILINIGMWAERFVIIVASLAHEYIPFAWGIYKPTWVEISIFAGTFAWFFLWFLLFAKLLPVISLTEVKELVPPPMRGRSHE